MKFVREIINSKWGCAALLTLATVSIIANIIILTTR